MPLAGALLATLLAFSVSAWLGAILFWSFAATPVMFKRLGRPVAGLTTRVVFPNYYLMGLLLEAVALGALAGWTLAEGGWRGPHYWLFGLLSLMFLITLTSRLAVLPAMDRHRAGREAGNAVAARAWGRAHGVSVLLNLATLVLGLGALGLVAWALA